MDWANSYFLVVKRPDPYVTRHLYCCRELVFSDGRMHAALVDGRAPDERIASAVADATDTVFEVRLHHRDDDDTLVAPSDTLVTPSSRCACACIIAMTTHSCVCVCVM